MFLPWHMDPVEEEYAGDVAIPRVVQMAALKLYHVITLHEQCWYGE